MDSDTSEATESGTESESSEEESMLRNRKAISEEEKKIVKKNMKQDLPCNANFIICCMLSFMFIIILIYIYAVYYLITYKRDSDRLEKFNEYYPIARGSENEDNDYEFKPLTLPVSVFSRNQNTLRSKKYRMIIGTLWEHYDSEIENILESMYVQMEKSITSNPVLMVVENVKKDIYLEPFERVRNRIEKEDSYFVFLDASDYRFIDHFRDNHDVYYENSTLPDSEERQKTCDVIAVLTHTLLHFNFDFFLFFDMHSEICSGDTLERITHGLSFFQYDKNIDFCSLKFSRDVTGMVFSREDLVFLTKYMEANIDLHPLDRLIHEYVYNKTPGKYKYCHSIGGKGVFSYKENLFTKRGDSEYPACHDTMSRIKYLHLDEYMYDRRCDLDGYDFSPCRKF